MSKKVFTPEATLSFPHLAEPQAPIPPSTEKFFTAALLFAPGTKLDALWAAAIEAVTDKWGAGAEKKLKAGALRSPFRTDWEAKNYPEGTVYINVKSKTQPGLAYLWPDTSKPVLPNGKHPPMRVPQDRITQDLYPGAVVHANVTAYAYDKQGNKGVAFGLNHIQKLKDGKRIDGRKTVEETFDADPAALEDLKALDALENSGEKDEE